MRTILRIYNQNKHLIWISILIIIGVVGLIRVLNNLADNKLNENKLNISNAVTVGTTLNKNYSVVTGKEVNSEVSKIIDEFINYCNNNQVEKAYELLSDECKEIFYPSLEDFTGVYYNKLFTSKLSYWYQAWKSSPNGRTTYRVDFTENMLATGNVANTSIIEYYTVVKNNDKYKLNINQLIGLKNINKHTTKDGLTINVKRKVIYLDYEIYEVEINNRLNETIIIDSPENADTIYIEDKKGERYYWNNFSIIEDDLQVNRLANKTIQIKFLKDYIPSNEITKIVFSNINLKNKIIKMELSLLEG